ncbi:MAG: RagB/SusD family nutrient uptake outer membrane protein [Tannerellaceae bacterium]|nr:RagB/SusD family nutrient uptake outer membrane protein [Tannerellaceae bacterium]
MKRYTLFFFRVIVGILLFSSCVDDVNKTLGTEYPENQDQEFDEEATFATIYASLGMTGHDYLGGNNGKWADENKKESNYAFFSTLFLLNEITTDEALSTWQSERYTDLMFNENMYDRTDDLSQELFKRLWYNLNLCDYYLEHAYGWSEEMEKRIAEVQFLKTLNYYYIFDLFGTAPVFEPYYWEHPLEVMERQLHDCLPRLSDPRAGEYGRVDKAAAWLLLARIYSFSRRYMSSERWDMAEYYARMVINSGYQLSPVYAHLFMADNDGSSVNQAPREIILPIRQSGATIGGWAGSTFVVATTHSADMPDWGSSVGLGAVRARAALVEKFFPFRDIPQGDTEEIIAAAGDDRALFYSKNRELYINDWTDFNQGISVTKWSNLRADGQPSSDSYYTDTDIPLMRLGEAYLILAEAVWYMRGNEEEVLSILNVLRQRANAEPFVPENLWEQGYRGMEHLIMQERARELYFEGHRRTDLNRSGYWDSWDWQHVHTFVYSHPYEMFPDLMWW